MIKVAIGQDSHRFEPEDSEKKLVLGGVVIEGCPGLEGNSDADVVLHALTNAVSGITCVNILGSEADRMCRQGITDSRAYLMAALSHMKKGSRILHVSISIEALRPKLAPHIEMMRASIAELMGTGRESVGITATTGEGLTEFGKGSGIFCTAIVTADVPD
jgi:2C-methyl-D-erythritol 2,4-cyclodiphosphate synthase